MGTTQPSGCRIPPANAGLGARTRARPGAGSQPVPQFATTLANDVANLMAAEMALARAELRDVTDTLKAGVSGMASGIAIAIAGTVALLMSGVHALALVLPLSLSALIVGVTAVALGAGLLTGGPSRLDTGVAPPGTLASLVKVESTAQREANDPRA